MPVSAAVSARSTMAVTPMPPAVHTEISPRFACGSSSNSFAATARMRAPVAANGWPTAMLLPWRLSFARSIAAQRRVAVQAVAAVLRRFPGLQRAQHLRGEGLVDLVEVEVLQRQVRILQHRRDRIGRAPSAGPRGRWRNPPPRSCRRSAAPSPAGRARFAQSSLASSTAAAPSVSGVLLPAVSVPALLVSNTGAAWPAFPPRYRRARCCRDPARRKGTTRSALNPDFHAAAARRWLCAASSSCACARDLPGLGHQLAALAHREARARFDHAGHHRLEMARAQPQPGLEALPEAAAAIARQQQFAILRG